MHRAKAILTFFLTVLLIALTVGISVFRHHCNCTNDTTASIIIEPPCSHEATHCCDHPSDAEASSCCTSETSTQSGQHCGTNGCCQTSRTVIAILDDYQVSQPQAVVPAYTVHAVVCSMYDEAEILKVKSEILVTSNHSPPPLGGRTLLTSIHQFKFDIPVC